MGETFYRVERLRNGIGKSPGWIFSGDEEPDVTSAHWPVIYNFTSTEYTDNFTCMIQSCDSGINTRTSTMSSSTVRPICAEH